MSRRAYITLALALSIGMAPAFGRSTRQPPESTRIGDLRQQVRPGIVVDGLPLVSIELQIWTGIEWAPLGSDDARRALQGREPIRGRRE